MQATATAAPRLRAVAQTFPSILEVAIAERHIGDRRESSPTSDSDAAEWIPLCLHGLSTHARRRYTSGGRTVDWLRQR